MKAYISQRFNNSSKILYTLMTKGILRTKYQKKIKKTILKEFLNMKKQKKKLNYQIKHKKVLLL